MLREATLGESDGHGEHGEHSMSTGVRLPRNGSEKAAQGAAAKGSRAAGAEGHPNAHFTRNIAPGIHRLEHAHVNCYLLEEDDEVTIVDAAFPDTWPLLRQAVRAIGRKPMDVRALVLTHGHFDHLGFALHARKAWGLPIWVHANDAALLAHPYHYDHESPRLRYPVKHPKAIPIIASMMAAGALRVHGVHERLHHFQSGEILDVPGHPTAIFTPGHTHGHTAFFLPGSSALISGDALVTLDPYTGEEGPQIVSGAATADHEEALRSLLALRETGAQLVLPGHGQPWRDVVSAVELALRAGPS